MLRRRRRSWRNREWRTGLVTNGSSSTRAPAPARRGNVPPPASIGAVARERRIGTELAPPPSARRRRRARARTRQKPRRASTTGVWSLMRSSRELVERLLDKGVFRQGTQNLDVVVDDGLRHAGHFVPPREI